MRLLIFIRISAATLRGQQSKFQQYFSYIVAASAPIHAFLEFL